VPSGREATCSE
jgi:hypothetical protein